MTGDPVRCAIYIRVSTDQQVDKYGLDAQRRETRATADQRGYHVVGEFVDGGVSGAKTERDGFDQVRALVRSRAVDVVLTQQHDRFWRNAGEHLVFLKALRDHGVRHDYVGWTPENTKEGRLQEGVLAVIAEYERELIRDRTMRGTREKARQGLHATGAAAYGYRRDDAALGGLAVDEAEATIIRRIFTWIADGAPLREVAHRLDAQGIAPRRGTHWSRTSIRNIVKSDLYLGTGVYNRRDETTDPTRAIIRPEADWITFQVTPLVSPELAARARDHLERNKRLLRGRPSPVVFLVGGVVDCGVCGRRMYGDNGNKTPTYRCEARSERDAALRCRFRQPAPMIDGLVWTALLNIIRDPDVLRSEAKRSRLGIDSRRVDAQTELGELQTALAKVAKSRARLIDLHVDGRLERLDFDARERPLAAETTRLEQAIEHVQARVVAGQADADRHAALVKYCALIGRGIERLDDAGRQAIVRKVVDRVVVHAERVELVGAFPLTLATGPEATPPQEREKTTGVMFQSPRELDNYSLRLTLPIGGLDG